jgi:4-hydroxybenzoyl-CoA thioesterase
VIVYERAVRFEEVDAARILFFARFLHVAHEAMEHFFAGLAGGYSHLITQREVGLPAVDVKMAFHAPVRYGDVLLVQTSTARLGNRSATLHYAMLRRGDASPAAEISHTVVTTDLRTLRSIDMPSDVRSILSAHLLEGVS